VRHPVFAARTVTTDKFKRAQTVYNNTNRIKIETNNKKETSSGIPNEHSSNKLFSNWYFTELIEIIHI